MNLVTSMFLRRMRAPFILVICAYTVAIIGLITIPGIDDKGNLWHMNIFQAFYYVSFTATTIGFGEIPYPLSHAQRLWSLVTIYITVISWFYALGRILTLAQDKPFREAATRSRFRRDVRNLDTPFYLVCGFGETGNAVVNSLAEEHFRTVVIEQDPDNLNELALNELAEHVPAIAGDASDPDQLELAGIRHPLCRGVIAVTPSDATNLKIAITSKLLHPDIRVACRSEIKEFADNMKSFNTDYIVNPYETFADIFAMAMHSPSLHLIYDWLTGSPNTRLSDPIYFRYGHWVLCGYGRFGKELFTHLHNRDIPTTIIDSSGEIEAEYNQMVDKNLCTFIRGIGFDAETLKQAGIDHAAGLIAGTDNDSNNLSIIMTARAINPDVFVVARQNLLNNRELYQASKANLVMRPREIIARKIRVLFQTPLLIDYLALARDRDAEWANITVSRLSAVVGEVRPHLWTVLISKKESPAVAQGLNYGRKISLGHLIRDPNARNQKLKCVPLLLSRDHEQILMPEDDIDIHAFDRILFCGTREVKHSMHAILTEMSSLNYVMTLKKEPESFVWRKLHRHFNREERRSEQRKEEEPDQN
jgi:Trk K+ transport system NAD-binding subunit